MFKSVCYFLFNLFSFEKGSKSFEDCCKSEQDLDLKEKNKDILIEKDQSWRMPLDSADKYSSPLFVKVKNVIKNEVIYTSNYSGDEINRVTMEHFKNTFILS